MKKRVYFIFSLILVIILFSTPIFATENIGKLDKSNEEEQAKVVSEENTKGKQNEDNENDANIENTQKEVQENSDKDKNNKDEDIEEIKLIDDIENFNNSQIESLQQKENSMENEEKGTQTIQNGTYIISSALNSDMVLDITGNSTKAGANVEIWKNNNQNNQKFNITYLGNGYYKMEVVSSGKYLSGTSTTPLDEDNVIQNTYQDKDIQKWIIKDAGNEYYYIISKASSLYLDLYYGRSTNGNNVQLYRKNQGLNQKFKFNKVDVVTGTQSVQNGTYTISSALEFNQALDVYGASDDNYANIELYSRNGGNNQKYCLEYLGDGYYKIIALHSGKALTVRNSSTNIGANVDQESYIGIDSQKWVIKNAGGDYYYIISKCNGFYLDLHGGVSNSGTNVEVYYANYKDWQKFKLTLTEINAQKTVESGNYIIASRLNTNKVIDIQGDITANNANVELWSNTGGNNQKFIITYLNDGYYTIKAFNSNKVLTVQNSSYLSGANVVQTFYRNLDSQKWAIQETTNGYYFIVNKLNGLVLDIQGATPKDGANAEVYERNSGNNQKFKFIKTTFSESISNGKYVILASSNNKKALDIEWASTENGANTQLWDSNGGSNQVFYIKYAGDGYYTIEAQCSKKLLTVKNGNVIQQEANNLDSQKWVIQKADYNGNYSFRSKVNDLYLDIFNNNMTNRTNIGVYGENDQNSQKFKIEVPEYKGIDVSKFNGNINWNQVSLAGIDFAIIRIGIRGYETGRIVFDQKFKENAINATNNGIQIGVYFVTQAVNYAEGVEEANQVLAKIREHNIKITYPIVLDIEWAGGDRGNNGRADNISADERTNATRGFCETIKNAGYIPMIYANKDWLKNYLNMSRLADFDVWLAHYVNGAPNKKSDYNGKYNIWQYTNSGSVQGINGNVDMNIGYKKYN